LVENHRFEPIIPVFGATVWADLVGISPRLLPTESWYYSWAIVWRCRCDPRLSRLCTTPDLWETDGHTGRQTHDDS